MPLSPSNPQALAGFKSPIGCSIERSMEYLLIPVGALTPQAMMPRHGGRWGHQGLLVLKLPHSVKTDASVVVSADVKQLKCYPAPFSPSRHFSSGQQELKCRPRHSNQLGRSHSNQLGRSHSNQLGRSHSNQLGRSHSNQLGRSHSNQLGRSTLARIDGHQT